MHHKINLQMSFMYNLCPRFSVLGVSVVVVTSVAVIEGMACFLFLLEYRVLLHRPVSLRITELVIFMQDFLCFSIYCLKRTLPSNSTTVSNAERSSGM